MNGVAGQTHTVENLGLLYEGKNTWIEVLSWSVQRSQEAVEKAWPEYRPGSSPGR